MCHDQGHHRDQGCVLQTATQMTAAHTQVCDGVDTSTQGQSLLEARMQPAYC